MTHDVSRQVLFQGLVYNEAGEPAEVNYIGGVAHYGIADAGFVRHVEALKIDSAVVARLQEQADSMQDEIVSSMLEMLGKKDLFTKAAIDASLRNLEENIRQSDPTQWLPWLQLFNFRVVVDHHGDIIELIEPTPPSDDD